MGLQEGSLQNLDIGNIEIVQNTGTEKALIKIRNHRYKEIKERYEKRLRELSSFYFDLGGNYIDSLDKETLQGFKDIISWKARRRALFTLAFNLISYPVTIGLSSLFNSITILGGLPILIVCSFALFCSFHDEIGFYFLEKELKKLDRKS